MTARRSVLAFAAASGRVAHVLVVQGTVKSVGMSRKASVGPKEARAYAARQIERFRPDNVITEKLLARSKKGAKTRRIIEALRSVAELADVESIAVVRGQAHANRFVEAQDLARRYPTLQPYLPKVRRLWDPEPKTLIYFEALSLIEATLGQAPSLPRRPSS
ncbi:hypothetical protein [Sulfitobacter sediminilitoris]